MRNTKEWPLWAKLLAAAICFIVAFLAVQFIAQRAIAADVNPHLLKAKELSDQGKVTAARDELDLYYAEAGPVPLSGDEKMSSGMTGSWDPIDGPHGFDVEVSPSGVFGMPFGYWDMPTPPDQPQRWIGAWHIGGKGVITEILPQDAKKCRTASVTYRVEQAVVKWDLLRTNFKQNWCWRDGDVVSYSNLHVDPHVTGWGSTVGFKYGSVIYSAGDWRFDHRMRKSVKTYEYTACVRVPTPVGDINFDCKDYKHTGRMSLFAGGGWGSNSSLTH